MSLDDSLRSEEADDDIAPLADALHQALECSVRGEASWTDDLLFSSSDAKSRLAGALEAADRLTQFVRHVQEASGIQSLSDEEWTAISGECADEFAHFPQPFPGEYRVRALLGSGSFGQVWLAEDVRRGVLVALKSVHLRGTVEERSRALAQLQNEAQKLTRLKHPHIVPIQAWRRAGDEHYLVMPYVSGGSLKARLEEEGPLGWRQAARYIADAAEALGHVHALGIIHRDIKPANLLWDEERDLILLTDFGLSVWLSEADTGDAAGTGCYMAIEALQGRGGLSADVYGLAATLFHLVTGEPPFMAPSWRELEQRIARGLPDPDPRCAALPAGLERIIRAGLTPDAMHRPPLAEFAESLRGCLNQLLADSLMTPAGEAPRPDGPALRLVVARLGKDGGYVPLAATERTLPRRTRNLSAVPPEPECLVLRTGDLVRIEAVTDRDGYLTVLNVGPTGHLSLLYPQTESAAAMSAGQMVLIANVTVTPPAGSERVLAIWSRERIPFSPAEHVAQEANGATVSRACRATRDLMKLEELIKNVPQDDWCAAAVELEHRAASAH